MLSFVFLTWFGMLIKMHIKYLSSAYFFLPVHFLYDRTYIIVTPNTVLCVLFHPLDKVPENSLSDTKNTPNDKTRPKSIAKRYHKLRFKVFSRIKCDIDAKTQRKNEIMLTMWERIESCSLCYTVLFRLRQTRNSDYMHNFSIFFNFP